jgi:hypothetical protein
MINGGSNMSQSPDVVDGGFTGDDFNQPDGEVGTPLTQTGEEYATSGRTRVQTRRGYAYRPHDESLPVITHTGVEMTKDEATAIIKEANDAFGEGYVSIVDETPNNEG